MHRLLSTMKGNRSNQPTKKLLRISEARFRALIEHSLDAIVLLAADGTYLYASPAMSRILGYAPEELIGRNTFELIHPDDRRRATDLFNELLQQPGASRTNQLRHRHQDGSWRWIEGVGTNLLAAPSVQAIVVNFRDISERKRAEQSLQESEARLRRLSEAAFEGIVVHEQGQILDANQTLATMFGYELSEVIGMNALDFAAPESRDLISKNIRSNYEKPYEVIGLRKDGTTFPIEVAGKAMPHQGRMVRVVAVRDIAERRQAEETLRHNEQRYQQLFAEAQRQALELSLLDQVRTALARELDLPVVIRTVVEAVAQTFGYTHVSLYLLNGDTLHLQHQVGYERVIAEVPVTAGISGRVVRTGQPVFLPDVRADPAFLGAVEGLSSEICIPLRDQGQVVGTLNVESTQGVTLTEADLQLMLAVSEHVNLAISRARLYAAVRESEARYRHLIDYAHDIIYRCDTRGRFTFFNNTALRLLKYSEAELMGRFYGDLIDPEYRKAAIKFYVEQLTKQIAHTYYEFPALAKDGAQVWLGQNVQLVFDQGKVVGIDAIARDITAQKQVEAELRARERYLRLLNEIGQIGVSESNFQDMLQATADRLGEIVNADGCYITLWDEAQQRAMPAAAYGSLRETYPTLRVEPDEVTMTQSVLRAGHTLVAEDVFDSPHISPRLAALSAVRSLVGLPLIAGEQKLGAALIGFKQPHHFTADEIGYSEQAAAQIALVIAKAHLFNEVQRLATTDELTGVLNRRQLFALGQSELVRARRFGHPLSAIMLDLDHFKHVNDTYGHAVGDQVLRVVAQLCKQQTRDIDIVGRYGGEEFAILLLETNQRGAHTVAERLRQCVADSPLLTERGELRLTISAGVACLDDECKDLAVLLEHADQALYAAKQAGRNQVVEWTP